MSTPSVPMGGIGIVRGNESVGTFGCGPCLGFIISLKNADDVIICGHLTANKQIETFKLVTNAFKARGYKIKEANCFRSQDDDDMRIAFNSVIECEAAYHNSTEGEIKDGIFRPQVSYIPAGTPEFEMDMMAGALDGLAGNILVKFSPPELDLPREFLSISSVREQPRHVLNPTPAKINADPKKAFINAAFPNRVRNYHNKRN